MQPFVCHAIFCLPCNLSCAIIQINLCTDGMISKGTKTKTGVSKSRLWQAKEKTNLIFLSKCLRCLWWEDSHVCQTYTEWQIRCNEVWHSHSSSYHRRGCLRVKIKIFISNIYMLFCLSGCLWIFTVALFLLAFLKRNNPSQLGLQKYAKYQTPTHTPPFFLRAGFHRAVMYCGDVTRDRGCFFRFSLIQRRYIF